MDRKRQLLWLLGGFVVTAALCGIAAALAARWRGPSEPASTPDVARYLTAAVSTSQALATEVVPSPSPTVAPSAEPSATPDFTPTASAAPAAVTPSATATATAAADACLAAAFVEDVTVPDGATFAPGEEFTKTWRLLNRGTCDWTTAFALVFVGGERLGAPEEVPLPQNVPAGRIIDLSVKMRAPTTPGEYRSYWKLRSDTGTLFGVGIDGSQPIWVSIRVVVSPTPPPPTATPTPAPATATPTPAPPTPTPAAPSATPTP